MEEPMKTILLIPAALLLASPIAEAQKKQSPYLECRRSGRAEQDCRHLMDPNLQKGLASIEETGRRSAAHLEEQKRRDAEMQRRAQQGR